MKIFRTLTTALALSTLSLSAIADDNGYHELTCGDPSGYGFDITLRNARSQGGDPDGTLFLYLNGGYSGIDKISQISEAFGLGRVEVLQVMEPLWKNCRGTTDTILSCHVTLGDQPVIVSGLRNHENAQWEDILALSKMTINFQYDAKRRIGNFHFHMKEYDTGEVHEFRFSEPCRKPR